MEPGDKRDRVIQNAESDGFDVVLYVGDEPTSEAIPGTKALDSLYVKLSFTHVYPDRIRQFLQRTIGETELIADAGA